jgi:hypothetical protein
MLGRFSLVTFLAFATFAPQPSFAWGDAGHRMVCRVAWDELLETPMAEVKEILGVTTEEAFADACAWPNQYVAEHPETAPWHEVYVPKTARDVDMARDCPQSTSCVLREIERNLDVLKSGAPREERATALKFLAHFVGDAHDPMHVAFAEDRGGRDISATFQGHASNLRAMWDTEMLDTDPAALDALASSYHSYTPLDRLFVDWLADLPEEWATESFWIMRTPATGYVGNPGGLTFDATYTKQNLPIMHDRIAKAGMRLGHLLNEALRAPIPR